MDIRFVCKAQINDRILLVRGLGLLLDNGTEIPRVLDLLHRLLQRAKHSHLVFCKSLAGWGEHVLQLLVDLSRDFLKFFPKSQYGRESYQYIKK